MAVEQKAVSKKKWITIVAPQFLGSEVIGETLALEPKALMGRYVTTSLAALTGDMKQHSVNVKLKVTSVEDSTAHTEVFGFEMSPSAIKRLVRRNSDRLDDSFVCSTADGKALRLKPVMLTASKTTGAVEKALRHKMIALVARETKALPYEEVVKSILSYKLQSTIRSLLRKTFPVKYFEIKRFEQARRGKPVVVVNEVQEPAPEDEQPGAAEA